MKGYEIATSVQRKLIAPEKPTIITIGDLILDDWVDGVVTRLSPEAPVPVLRANRKKRMYHPGGAGNTAVNLYELGADVTLYGRLGDDREGRKFREELARTGVKLSAVTDDEETITKTRLTAGSTQLLRLDWERDPHPSISSTLEEEVTGRLRKVLPEAKAVMLSDYDKGMIREYGRTVITLANEYGVPTVADFKPKNLETFKGVTLACPNRSEAEDMVERALGRRERTLFETIEALEDILGTKHLVITDGKQGMWIKESDKEPEHVPVLQEIEVSNVAGAGDTVAAMLSMCLAAKYSNSRDDEAPFSLRDTAALANIAAGFVVQRATTSSVTMDDVRSYLQRMN